jgi:hypothetical protein
MVKDQHQQRIFNAWVRGNQPSMMSQTITSNACVLWTEALCVFSVRHREVLNRTRNPWERCRALAGLSEDPEIDCGCYF